ncbi:MmgE/PrpD family protein [Nocardia grenadensis]|uniref:MmgE/PrpD family protein n=1 Tax=Nocardia grenadensis TaxID=931537 RepID=UPI003D70A2A2
MRVTEVVARFAVAGAVSEDSAPAIRSLIDTVGVAFGGRDAEATRAITAFAETEPSAGRAVVWGAERECGPSQAALINGTAAHALDFDDACPSMPLHPSTVLWPALLAVVDEHTDPARLVAAIEVGNTVMRALGEVLPMDVHYGRGWHSTATVGRVAAVAALARLRGLSIESTRYALGAVASMAGGSIANFGTATKPLHAGSAARDAVVAVGLVEAGLTAAVDQLEHPKGFLALFGDPDAAALAALPERLDHWARHWSQDWSLKRYPCCYGTHRAIDAVLELRAEVVMRDIETIAVHVHPGSVRPLIDHEPGTGSEGKFSLPFTVAHALRYGRLGIGGFTDAAVADAETRALMRRVTVHPEPSPAGRPELAGRPYALVRLTTADGTARERLVTIARGDARNPLTDDEIADKFRSCVTARGRSAAAAESLLTQLREALSVPGALAVACASLRGGETAAPI